MHRVSVVAVFLVALFAPPAAAQVRHVDPSDKTGTSAAVVVADHLALLHTTQILPVDDKGGVRGKGNAGEQIRFLLASLAKLLKSRGAEIEQVIKINFSLAKDDLMDDVQAELATFFAGPAKPAVGFVTGKLLHPDALVALDAIAAIRTKEELKQAKIEKVGALLPPGTRIWIAGQAEKGNLAEATRKTMESLAKTLAFLKRGWGDVVQLRAFVHPMADAEIARREMATFFKGAAPPMVFVEWESSLPIEIELVAWGGPDRAGEPIDYLTPPGMTASPVYSRVTRVNYGKLIYIGGLHSARAGLPEGEILDVFGELGKILKKTGSDYHHLAKATYYVTDAPTTKKMGELRPRFYDPKRPPSASLAMVAGTGRAGHSVTLDMIAVPAPHLEPNDYGPPEYGHGLNEKDALAGWISLFDGKTDFGWKGATLKKAVLHGGETTSHFDDIQLRLDVAKEGTLVAGGKKIPAKRGLLLVVADNPGSIRLEDGLAVHGIRARPLKMRSLFNGKDLQGWKRIDHPRLPKESAPAWKVEDGLLHVSGGPGALEYQGGHFGDFILQVEVRTTLRFANGGLFFRAIPGDFMNGYEAQIYNRCRELDVAKPYFWATGAIDDRQNARRLVSRDGRFWLETVLAHGPHIATWINGHQVVDWTDTRPKDDNPRKGLRVTPGSLQLQAHDVATKLEFRRVEVR